VKDQIESVKWACSARLLSHVARSAIMSAVLSPSPCAAIDENGEGGEGAGDRESAEGTWRAAEGAARVAVAG
jgi:hypothetical protein